MCIPGHDRSFPFSDSARFRMTPIERAFFTRGIRNLARDRQRERLTLGGICILHLAVLGTNSFHLARGAVSFFAFLAVILATWRLANIPSGPSAAELVDDKGELTDAPE